ncbi:MAG: PAS domain-containing protein, partial [Alphaproteobacteria bacterium]|nr:PAS domain-containing protein [Alphaproteobacteria bacterium]
MGDPTYQLAIAGLGLVLLALGVAAVVCGIGVIRRRERRLLEEFQRRVERSLADCRVSEERLAEAQRIGNMGSWEWNIASNDLIWSEQVYRIFGFDRQFAPTYDAYLERIHVDDREYLGQAINNAMFENTPYQIEHRIVRPDGEIRVLAAHGEVELSDAGLPVKMIGVCQDVTERAMLREESETQRLLLRNVLDGMYVFVGLMKADGVLIDVNRASAEAVGLLPSDLIGLALWDSHFWNYSTSSQNVARAAIARAAAGEIVRRDYVVRLRDNEFITVDVVFSPLRDRDGRITQIIGSGVDVTERVKVERENQQSSFRLEQAQRIASIGSWEWDFVSDTLSWSEQCYRIVGLDPREVRASFELFLTCTHPDDRCIVEEAARAAMEHGAPCDFDQRIVLPSGEVRIVHQLGEVETDAAGKAIRLNGTTQDVTELRTACAELVDAKLRAEEANHSKSNFLANMSHELRTPLNAIIGFSEILMSDTPLSADKRAEYASDIHSSGRHLLSVINDILDISRIEAGKVTLDDDVVEIS